MSPHGRHQLVATSLVLLLLAAAPARADKCTGAKLKAVGKKAAGLLACQAKVAATNDASGLMACESKVKGKFSAAFGKAGSCTGDETNCEDIADGCESAVATAMTEAFPSRCEASKRKAAGKLARGELGCYAKAALKGAGLDSGCITKAQAKFGTVLGKAGACPDGGYPQMLVEDNCVAPAVTADGGGMVTDVCPTTTTTTSTTTTTTSTTTTTTSTSSTMTTSTTTTTTSTSTTTTTTFPSCDTAGATCGTCGNGMCFPLCDHGCALGCIDTSAGSGRVCSQDAQCDPGEICAANRPPAGQCGDCGGVGTGCQMPCPGGGTGTTTTTTTIPVFPCAVQGASCGSCGNGECEVLCGHGGTLGCVDMSAGSGRRGCFNDSMCDPGELCWADTGGNCGSFFAGQDGCNVPCP